MAVPDTCCRLTDRAFTKREARREASLYRRRGPARQTQELLDAIRSLGFRAASLLDIGGGIGVLHHGLLDDVARTAVHVDASLAYLREARGEAVRRGHGERVTFVHSDFTDIASDLPDADIVTLDRVVCCYPDVRSLLTAAARKSRSLLAMSYPRQTWYTRLGVHLLNAFQRLRRDPFRSFIHPVGEMEQLLGAEGMQRISLRRLSIWEVAVYRRI
jgi:magnesium-protoporphyrin O-methyltransferase